MCQGREELGKLAKRVVFGVWWLVSGVWCLMADVWWLMAGDLESREERDRGA